MNGAIVDAVVNLRNAVARLAIECHGPNLSEEDHDTFITLPWDAVFPDSFDAVWGVLDGIVERIGGEA